MRHNSLFFVTVVPVVVTFVAIDIVVVGVVIVVVVGDGDGVGPVSYGSRGLYRQETKQCGTTRSFS